MTSILLADGAPAVPAPLTCTPESCPGPAAKLAPQIHRDTRCWGTTANTPQLGIPGWEQAGTQAGDKRWLSFDTRSSYAWSKIIKRGSPLSETTAGQ